MIRIIAEAGVNHNGDMDIARRLIDVAKEAGADYVKFQTFKAARLVSPEAPKAEYQIANSTDNSNRQMEMLRKLELSREQHIELKAYCAEKDIRFLSTAFDLESIDLLLELGMDLFKIPSGEITNKPYLQKIGGLKKEVILSTGMCEMEEISEAIEVLVSSGTSRENITILHCTTDYPTKMADVNLRAMQEIRQQLKLPVGYSDHTLGIEVPIAAVAMGASIIEKHFTISRSMPGPDHKASLEPEELKNMVSSIRNIEAAIGTGQKLPTPTELKNRIVARKSIHISRKLSKGQVISEADLEMKRPGSGISPMQMEMVIGKKITKNLSPDHLLKWEDLE